MTGSNRRPSRCKRDALPTELTARGAAGAEPLSRSTVERSMFFMISNRLGCGASLLISAAVTLVLLIALGWINL